MVRRLTLVLLSGGMVLSLLTAVPAAAATSFTTWTLCLRYNTNQCLNLKGGVEQKGQEIQLWDLDTAGTPAQFEAELDGTVTESGANPWPFTPGSGYNAQYAGDDVYIIPYSPGGTPTNWCVGVQTDNVNAVSLDNACYLSPPISLFVQISATNWVNVYAQDQPSLGTLWTDGIGNGEQVLAQAANGFYNWEAFNVTWPSGADKPRMSPFRPGSAKKAPNFHGSQ